MIKKQNIIRSLILSALAVFAVSCSIGEDSVIDDSGISVSGSGGGRSDGIYQMNVSAGRESGSDSTGDAATRAVMMPWGEYYWSGIDRVGMTVSWHDMAYPVTGSLHNLMMTSDVGGANLLQTTFTAPLSDDQANAMPPWTTYDYYSYFPYKENIGPSFPIIRYPMPGVFLMTPDHFDPELAPMVAEPILDQPPAVFLRNGVINSADFMNLRYMHVMSYVALDMDVALVPEPVIAILITDNTGMPISGDLDIDMRDGTVSIENGSPTIEIAIPTGMAAGGGVLYVPMLPVDMSDHTFTFTFITANQNNVYVAKNVPGMNFVRGQVHRLRIAPYATYTATTTFTVTKTGYYHVEAWGARGGDATHGTRVAYGGIGGTKDGLFYLIAGQTVEVAVGLRGGNANSRTGNGAGGVSTIGAGGNGGTGGAGRRGIWEGGNATDRDAFAGGGGGGASGIRVNGAVRLSAGGGGGGGGYPGLGGGSLLNEFDNWYTLATQGGKDASDTNQGQLTSDETGNTSGGSSASGTGGGTGGSGRDGTLAYNYGGSGGGGGGGGYPYGGYGGYGRANGNQTSGRRVIGDGGGGGMNSVTTAATNPGNLGNIPLHSKPQGREEGYVVITYMREQQ